MITNIRMVIDIPKYVYDTCKDLSLVADADVEKVGKAIANGTLLPKGHGALKDIDKIISDGISKGFCDWYDEMKYAPTIIEADTGKAESEGSLSWLGKRCEDCGNKKCKELVELPKGYDCALWQPKVENYSIKMVTNAKEAENYPISEDISKGIEEINKLIFENGQA